VTDYGIIRAPYLFVDLKLNPGISSFQKIHNDYLLATKEDISEVLFNKIMFYSGVDPENILLHVGCSNQFEYTSIFKGNNEPKLQWLQVGGCSEPWSVISEELLSKNSKIFNAQPGQKTEIGELNKDIGREAEIFLNTIYFKESKFKPLLDFKRQDKYQFDVIIRGMKGLIIHGGDKWEKIRLRLKVREGVDGKYLSLETSALYAPRSKSDYPADNYFEKDYELTGDEGKVKEFGDALLTAFLKHLNK
jgi:hypothetical protein